MTRADRVVVNRSRSKSKVLRSPSRTTERTPGEIAAAAQRRPDIRLRPGRTSHRRLELTDEFLVRVAATDFDRFPASVDATIRNRGGLDAVNAAGLA